MSSTNFRMREMKACNTCARAKVKCETEYRREKCKRCYRLGKACEIQPPGAHSNKKALDGQSRRADILRLESKVDSVSQLLSSSTRLASVSPNPTLSPSTYPLPGIVPEIVMPSDYEAKTLLDLYRTEFGPLFPFVVVPSHVTAEELRQEKRILHMCIMMVACQSDVERQLNLARMVRYEISQALLVRGEKNLALLQGVLVYAAWNHMHLQLNAQLFNFLHLAISLMYELGLDKEAHTYSRTAAGAMSDFDRDRKDEPMRTLDGRRATLGVYWTASMVKTCFRDLLAPRFSRYMDQCCQILQESKENINDVFLVQIVRLQQTAQKVGDMFYGEEADSTMGMSPPLAMGITMLEEKFLQSEAGLALEISQAREFSPTQVCSDSNFLLALLQMSYKTLGLHFYKVALDDRFFTGPLPSVTTPLLRTNLLTSCLSIIQSLVTLFLTCPTRTLLSLPYPFWGQMGHAMLILKRLAEVKYYTWDLAYVPGALDHKEVCRRMASRLEEVTTVGRAEVPPRGLPDVFKHMITKLKEMGDVTTQPQERANANDDILGGSDFSMLDDEMTGGFFEFFDFGHGLQ